MKSIPFPLRPGKIDDEFRFGVKSARDLERAAGCNYQTLFARGQQIEAICLLTCFGLRHDPQFKNLTPDGAADLIDAYVAKDGDIVKLYEALQAAMNHSGVYGPAPAEDSEERPTAPTETAAPA